MPLRPGLFLLAAVECGSGRCATQGSVDDGPEFGADVEHEGSVPGPVVNSVVCCRIAFLTRPGRVSRFPADVSTCWRRSRKRRRLTPLIDGIFTSSSSQSTKTSAASEAIVLFVEKNDWHFSRARGIRFAR